MFKTKSDTEPHKLTFKHSQKPGQKGGDEDKEKNEEEDRGEKLV